MIVYWTITILLKIINKVISIPVMLFRQAIRSHQQSRTMKVLVNKVLADNYQYLLVDDATREALVVDLGDSKQLPDIERRGNVLILIKH